MTRRLANVIPCVLLACTVSASTGGANAPASDSGDAAGAPVAEEAVAEATPETGESAEEPGVAEPLFTVADDAPDGDASCDARFGYAQQSMQALGERAAQGCTSDADCVLAEKSVGCFGACWAPINSAHQDAFDSARAAIDEHACTGFAEGGCPYMTPGCVEPKVFCDAGTCALR